MILKAAGTNQQAARKKEAQTKSQVDTKAIEALKARLETIATMPECDLTDEELGLAKLNAVLPDTWQNISWVL